MFMSRLIWERLNRRFPVRKRHYCQCPAKVPTTCRIWLLLLLCFSTIASADNIVSRPVGFVRIAVPPNKNVLTSIPFYAFKKSIDEVLKGQLTGATNETLADRVIKWDPQFQEYESAFKAAGTSNPLVDGHWFRNDVDWVTSSLSLNPGEAFWIENRQTMTQSVLLAGFVVLDDVSSVLLYPALNLFSYPFSSKIALNNARLAEDGAIGAAVMTNADRVTESVLNRTFWLLHDTNSPNHGKWLDGDSLVANEELLLGRGYWYNGVGIDKFAWKESRPYADVFPADEQPPAVTAMALGSDGSEVTLTIATYGSIGEMLEIYYKDVLPTGSLDTVNGWILAAKDISSAGHTSVQWVDDGAGGRGRIDSVFARFYLIGRGDIDSDGDKLPDCRETFVHGTSTAQSDTDGDGSPDGWEIEQGLDPLNGKDGVKGIGDRLANEGLIEVTAMELDTVSVVTIWPTSAVPIQADGGADDAVELGVKFRSDVAGTIDGIRFYKATANTGVHIGNLWTSNGTQMATATFSSETALGWQQALFVAPVAIASNTVYVASYHATNGHYSCDINYFHGKGMDSPPLHALATVTDVSSNGVYAYGPSSLFPTQTWNAANYWVDVVFQAGSSPTLTSIAVTPVSPSILIGASQQFTATGTYSDNSTQNLSNRVTWTSSNTGVATISTNGLATGGSAGTTTISVALGVVSGNTITLTVLAPPAILTSTNAVTVPEGETTNFQVKLSAAPISPTTVTVSRVSGGDTNLIVQSGTSLVFSASNWDASQTVTLGAAADADWTNGSAIIQCSAPGLTAANVTATERDNTPAPLAIVTASLPNGISNVAYSVTLTATNGTLSYNWSLASGALPSGLTLNAVSGAIAGRPTASGIFSFTAQVMDSGSPVQTATKPLSITITSTSMPTVVTIWPTSAAPIQADGGADDAVELGVKFRSDVAGTIDGIRFYKATANTGVHIGNLWTSNGTQMATATFSSETALGWQQALFVAPVAIASNTVYVASYHATNGHYSCDINYFHGKGMDSPPLHALATVTDVSSNGVYAYGPSSLFPTQTWNAANYWVDVVFQAGSSPTLTSIAVTPVSPSILIGASQQFTATGTYSDNSTQNLSNRVTWTSSNTGVATINTNGLATGGSAGTTTISVALGVVSGNTITLTVLAPPAILTSTNAVTVPEGETTNFQVKLSAAPISPTTVTVSRVSGGDTNLIVQSGTSLVFSASNWDASQTVTLGAAADADWTNGSAIIQCSAPGLTAANVTATERDNTPAPLAIVTASLPNGISNVAYSVTLTATNGTLSYNWSLASGALPSGLTLNAVSGAIAGRPTASGIFSFTAQVMDSGSPVQTATKPLSITITSTSMPTVVTIWPTSAAPIQADGGADDAVELGVKFRSDVAGTIDGIRFYKATANTGVHIGNLWTSNGTQMATATFSSETALGWQQALFVAPVAIASNTVYVASYHATNGHYSCDINYFHGKGMDSPPLHALATVTDVSSNGVYAYGPSSLFPTQTWNAANYWVDVVFQAGSSPTLTSIAVTPVSPSILIGASQQFTATGTYSDNSTQNLSNRVTWTSSNTGVATINTNGLATGGSAGTTTISVALGVVSGNTITLTVLAPPAILTSTNAVTVPEGETTNFQVKLSAAPISPTTVTVSRVSGGDTNLIVQSGTSLVFSASNWDASQTVTLGAAADADWTNGSAIIQCSAPGLTAANVTATERDNTPGLKILTSTNAVSVPEGDTADFQVKLDSAPDNPTTVTVSRVSGDEDIVVQSGTSFVFNASNWNTDRTVTLFAVSDPDQVNDSAIIRCSAPGLASNDVMATEQDNTPAPAPDLVISANDIEFSPTNPAPNSPVKISVRVHNRGSVVASNVTVRFFANGIRIGDEASSKIKAGGARTASIKGLTDGEEMNIEPGGKQETSISIQYTNDETLVIGVNAKLGGTSGESDESNNWATKLLHPSITARIVVRANVPSISPTNSLLGITGLAYYELPYGIITNTYPVEGAIVSVQIETGTVYSGSFTYGDGRFNQSLLAPEKKGMYRLYVTVSDNALSGQDEVALIVGDLPPPSHWYDLSLKSCGGFTLGTNWLREAGDTTTVDITVWNHGNATSDVTAVRLYDMDRLVASAPIARMLPETTSSVSFVYTPTGTTNSYRVLRAEVAWTTNEANPFNNAATKVIKVGDPSQPPDIVVSELGVSSPVYVGQYVLARGKAHYQVDVDGTLRTAPVSGGNTVVTVNPGGMVYDGAQVDSLGNAVQGIWTPSTTGAYSVVMTVDDCPGGWVNLVSDTDNMLVIPLPGDVWVYSQDITFDIDNMDQAPTNYPFEMRAALHYASSETHTVSVVVNDWFTDAASNWVHNVLYSNAVAFTESGDYFIQWGYTGVVAGVHVIEVDIAADFGDRSNDEATHALQIGPANPLLVVSIMAPANGETMEPDPYLVRVRVLDERGQIQTTNDLMYLTLVFEKDGKAIGSPVVLFDRGELKNHAYFDEASGEFRWIWDPADTTEGRVEIQADAVALDNSSGSDRNYVTLIPKPVDLAVQSSDIHFTTNAPKVDESVRIDALIHNLGSDAVTGVVVRFFANGSQLGTDQVIGSLAGDTAQVVSVNAMFTQSEVMVIGVAVDPENVIAEMNEWNNNATRLIAVGGGVGARLVVKADFMEHQCPAAYTPITGFASYEIPVGAITYRYPVEGADVSVRIETGTVYNTATTVANGDFSQPIVTPVGLGGYRLYVSVSDQTLQGQDEVFLTVAECPPPVHWVDLEARACDGLSITQDVLSVGSTVSVSIVVWNLGDMNARDVGVSLYDMDQLVASGVIGLAPAGGSSSILLRYTVGGSTNSYRILRAEVEPGPAESNPNNNAATKVVKVGNPEGEIALKVKDLDVPSPLTVGQWEVVKGRVYYEGDLGGGITNVMAAAVTMSVKVGLSQTNAGSRTDRFGNAGQGISAPSVTGEYEVVMTASDCSMWVEPVCATGRLEVTPMPDDVWVYSRDIHFGNEVIEETGQAPTNYPFEITAILHHAVNTRTNAPVVVWDWFTDAASNFVYQVLYSNDLDFAGSGNMPISWGYTGVVAGAHIVKVDIESDFGNLSNDEATRALQIGPPQPLLVVNIDQPVNGETFAPDPTVVRVKVADEGARAQAQTNLSLMVMEIKQGTEILDTKVLVQGGETKPGTTYISGEYYTEWDPADTLRGRVDIRVWAVKRSGIGSGEDQNYVTLIPKPVDLEINSEDISFSTNRPEKGETVVITARVHNVGTEGLTNVAVRFSANGVQLGTDQVIASLAGGAFAEVSVNAAFADQGARVIGVWVDPTNAIVELDEKNNKASRILTVGYPQVDAELVLTANANSPVCPGSIVDVTGSAEYQIDEGGMIRTFAVEGARVSVQVETVSEFSTVQTDVGGQYRQSIATPTTNGIYLLTIGITDGSIGESNTIWLAADSASCPGVPPPVVDLAVRGCEGFTVGTNALDLGDSTAVTVTVWNVGNVNVSDVQVKLFDWDQVVATNTIGQIPAGSSRTALLNYTAGEPQALHVLRLEVLPKPGEVNLFNNQATRLIAVGDVTGAAQIVVTDLSVPDPLYRNQSGIMSARAYYRMDGIASNPAVVGAETVVQIGTNEPGSGAVTDIRGVVAQYITAPAETGNYEVAVSMDDCSGLATFVPATGTMSVIKIPDDVWVYSRNIHFEGDIDESPQVATNIIFDIWVELNHSIDGTVDVPVSIRDIYPRGGTMATDVLWSTTVTMSGSGKSFVSVTYTGAVAAAHIIQVAMVAGFGNRSDDEATRTLQVGDVTPGLVANMVEPVYHQEITATGCLVRLKVLQNVQSLGPTNLAILVAEFRQYPGYSEVIKLVENGDLVNGIYTNGEYQLTWDPPDHLLGHVEILVLAQGTNGSHGIGSREVTMVSQISPNLVKNLNTHATYPDIQQALNAAIPGYSIAIRHGTYALSAPITLVNGVKLSGGYDAGWNLAGGPETTVIDGQNLTRCFYGSGLSAQTEMANLTVRNGFAGTNYDADGGGMKLENQSKIVISNCVFSENRSTPFQPLAGERYGGGALSIRFSSPLIVNCSFVSNQVVGGVGGAIRNFYSSPTITGCVFSANSAVNGEGANIYNTYSSPTLVDTEGGP